MRQHITTIKITKIALAVSLTLGVAACTCSRAEADIVNAVKEISFVHLNDLHAHLVPHTEQVRDPKTGKVVVRKAGGLARIATKIDEIRAQHANSILMNIGDTYHGGAEAMFTIGNAIVDPVNALDIDVGTPGNWDFAYGPVITNARYGAVPADEITGEVKKPSYKIVAANMIYRDPPMAQEAMYPTMRQMFHYTPGEYVVDPTYVVERDGIKIGFIGLTSDIVERMHIMMAFNLEFTQGRDAYLTLLQEQAQKLRDEQGVNMVAVISELGIHKDWALANDLPAGVVDVFFSAHTHEATYEKKVAKNGTVVVEAGNDTYLGEMTVQFEDGDPTAYTWKLHEITMDITPKAEIATLVSEARAPFLVENPNITSPIVTLTMEGMPPMMREMMQEMMSQMSTQAMTLSHSLDHELGMSNVPIDRRHALENNFNNAYSDMLRNYSHMTQLHPEVDTVEASDVAMTPGFRFDSSVIPSDEQLHEHPLEEQYHYWEIEPNNTYTIDGTVTVADVYRFMPAPYLIAQGHVTGARLKEIIEGNLNAVFSLDAFEQSGGWMDGFSGLKVNVDLARPEGQRILEMRYKERDVAVADDDEIIVIGCARPMDMNAETTLCSYEGFTGVHNLLSHNSTADMEDPLSAADFLIFAIQQGMLEQVELRRDIEDVNATKMWSDTEFYQPLNGALHTRFVEVIEFRNQITNHYFITASASEAEGIDNGAVGPDWVRTGLSFKGWLPDDYPNYSSEVCRFWSTPYQSHFYTSNAYECEQVKENPNWSFEGASSFYMVEPKSDGTCSDGFEPVYRLYNNRHEQNDGNHRYTTDVNVYDQMTQDGWLQEGVAFCSPVE